LGRAGQCAAFLVQPKEKVRGVLQWVYSAGCWDLNRKFWFIQLATDSPWSLIMNGWSGDPVPVEFLNERPPLERQSALVFRVKRCRNCHLAGGSGGKRGPALERVATNLTRDQLVRQVIQGGGNMPARGKNPNPDEVTALVSFLGTLRPTDRPAAHDASQAVLTQEQQSLPPANAR
jgi:ubiquinol-cytochrome c reductase cytochrome b subunit